jgi:hypothetical protein
MKPSFADARRGITQRLEVPWIDNSLLKLVGWRSTSTSILVQRTSKSSDVNIAIVLLVVHHERRALLCVLRFEKRLSKNGAVETSL